MLLCLASFVSTIELLTGESVDFAGDTLSDLSWAFIWLCFNVLEFYYPLLFALVGEFLAAEPALELFIACSAFFWGWFFAGEAAFGGELGAWSADC